MNFFIKKTLVIAMKFIAVLLLCGSPIIMSAQHPTIEWQKNYGGSKSDQANAIIQTNDGGYIACGFSVSSDHDLSFNNGLGDVWLTKFNAIGNIEWDKILGGSLNDIANSIQQTTDGGYIIAGYSDSNDGDLDTNRGQDDAWIIKLDSLGNLQWNKTYGGSNNDVAICIQQTLDGGYVAAGYSASNDGDVGTNRGSNDYWILKINSAGNMEWNKTMGGTEYEAAYSIVQTTDKGYIVAGSSASINGDVVANHGNFDSWIVKLDTVGNIIWKKAFGGSSRDDARSIKQTNDGGYIIAGGSYSMNGNVSNNNGAQDAWIVKLNAQGNIDWERNLGGSLSDVALSVQQTLDDGYILAGYSSSSNGDLSTNQGSEDVWIVKLNTQGNIVWQKSLGGSQREMARAIQQTNDAGYIVAGYSASANGDLSGNYGNDDFWLIKLSAVYPANAQNILSNDERIMIHPNPASTQLYIKTSLSLSGMELYNLQGKHIKTFNAASLNKIDVSSLVSGNYYLRVQSNEGVVVKEFIKK